VDTCPILIKGCSTGFAPTHVRITVRAINVHIVIFFRGENFFMSLFSFRTRVDKIKIAPIMAKTPPSFDGIDRRIA